MNKPRILIVEDDNEWQEIYRRCLGEAAYEIMGARKVGTALSLLQEQSFDVVITDLKMLGGTEEFSGFRVLDQAKVKNPDIQVIVITGFGSADHALRAMGNGAYDYITKDRDLRNKLALTVQGALEVRSLKKEMLLEKIHDDVQPDANQIIGNSGSMQTLFEQIAQASENDINILIQGEGGTGKRLIAQTIHLRSQRKNGPFLVVDCGRLSETVLEAELFGYEAGTLYSATESRAGKFEQAQDGTIFLEGFGDLNIDLQPRLIGAICDRRVERIGSKAPVSINARIIASTDKDLQALSKTGRFERKLFDALSEYVITVPPLRKRKDGDDIPALAAMFLQRYKKNPHVIISKEAIELLKQYDYPGNVRELESIVKHALSVTRDTTIMPEHLRPEVREASKMTDQQKDPSTILRVSPLNGGDCTKKEEIIRLYSPRRVFVNIPYSDDFEDHEKVIRETLEAYGLVPVVSKDHLEPGMLLCNVCKLLQTCKYGITDISEPGTSVFYELGLMHAIGIHCAILKNRRSKAMSDIGGLLFLEYTSPQSLKEKLELWIRDQVKEARIPSAKSSETTGKTNVGIERPSIYIGNITVGENANVGDIILASEIQKSFNKADSAGIQFELKETLKQLIEAVDAMNRFLPQEQAVEASEDLAKLVDEVIKPSPNKKWYSVSIDGLVKAAENVEKVGEPVINLSQKLLSLLTGGVIR